MRILIASDFLFPVTGGAEKHCVRLGRHLVERGHEVEFVTMSVEGEPRHDVIEGLPTTRLGGHREKLRSIAADPQRVHHLPIPDRRLAAEFAEVVDRFRPDVINPHGQITLSALSIADQLPPIVPGMHDFGIACARRTAHHRTEPLCPGPSLAECLRCAPQQYGAVHGSLAVLGLRSSKRLWNRASEVLVVSDAVRRAAVAAGYVEPERIRVVPNWCDDRSVLANGAEPRPAFCGEGRYVLFLGGTSVFKGAHALVDIWRDHAPAANLVMVGSPDQSFDRTLPPRVQVVGYQPSEQVAAAIASAEMVVVATQGPDACPGVAIEATTLGVPTIGTFVGGIPEIVRDGINGFTFEVGDLASMGAAITEILGNAQLRSRLSEGARSVAPDYSSTTVVNQIEAAFERAVARATRKAQGEPVAAQAASRSRTYTTSGEIGSEPPSTTSVT